MQKSLVLIKSYLYIIRYAIDATKIDKELHWTPDETFATGKRPLSGI